MLASRSESFFLIFQSLFEIEIELVLFLLLGVFFILWLSLRACSRSLRVVYGKCGRISGHAECSLAGWGDHCVVRATQLRASQKMHIVNYMTRCRSFLHNPKFCRFCQLMSWKRRLMILLSLWWTHLFWGRTKVIPRPVARGRKDGMDDLEIESLSSGKIHPSTNALWSRQHCTVELPENPRTRCCSDVALFSRTGCVWAARVRNIYWFDLVSKSVQAWELPWRVGPVHRHSRWHALQTERCTWTVFQCSTVGRKFGHWQQPEDEKGLDWRLTLLSFLDIYWKFPRFLSFLLSTEQISVCASYTRVMVAEVYPTCQDCAWHLNTSCLSSYLFKFGETKCTPPSQAWALWDWRVSVAHKAHSSVFDA